MKASHTLAIIWLIFVIIFASFGIYHFIESTKDIPSIKLELKKPVIGSVVGVSTGIGAVKKFAKEMSEYVDNYNKSSKRQNRIAALGYFAAALTALVSMGIELRNAFNSWLKSG